jgi:hypothetical protein
MKFRRPYDKRLQKEDTTQSCSSCHAGLSQSHLGTTASSVHHLKIPRPRKNDLSSKLVICNEATQRTCDRRTKFNRVGGNGDTLRKRMRHHPPLHDLSLVLKR